MPGMNPPPPVMKRYFPFFEDLGTRESLIPPILTLFHVKACEAAALTEAARRLVAKIIPWVRYMTIKASKLTRAAVSL
jgi:hypothetical protein